MAPCRNRGSFYAVRVGRNIGIFRTWHDCEKEVKGFQGAKYKKFETRGDAELFVYGQPLDSANALESSITHTTPSLTALVPKSAIPCHRSPIDEAQGSIAFRATTPSSMLPVAAASSARFAQTIVSAHPNSSSLTQTTTAVPPNLPTATSHSAATTSTPPSSADTRATRKNGSSPQRDLGTSLERDVVYIAGTCPKATGIASIGVWWGPHDPRNLTERCPGKQTKKRAELLSIARLLESAEITERPLVIRTGSEYFINCFKIWLKTWKANNWLNSNDHPVKRADLLRYITTCLEMRANLGQKVVVAYAHHRHGPANANAGMEGARRLAAQAASSSESSSSSAVWSRAEPDWGDKELSLLQFHRPIVALNLKFGRGKVAVTEILGPDEVSEDLFPNIWMQEKKWNVVGDVAHDSDPAS